MAVKLSRREREIMDILFELGEVSARDILEKMSEPPGYSAIRAMLAKLLQKGSVQFRQEGNRYLYRSRIRRTDCLRSAASSFVDRVFDGEAAPMLAHFVRNVNLTADEIAELKQILEEQERTQ